MTGVERAGVTVGRPTVGPAGVEVGGGGVGVSVAGHVPVQGVAVGLGPTVRSAVDVGAGTEGVTSGGATAWLSTRAEPTHPLGTPGIVSRSIVAPSNAHSGPNQPVLTTSPERSRNVALSVV